MKSNGAAQPRTDTASVLRLGLPADAVQTSMAGVGSAYRNLFQMFALIPTDEEPQAGPPDGTPAQGAILQLLVERARRLLALAPEKSGELTDILDEFIFGLERIDPQHARRAKAHLTRAGVLIAPHGDDFIFVNAGDQTGPYRLSAAQRVDVGPPRRTKAKSKRPSIWVSRRLG
ncbi:O-methyltransferase [Actibacterium sp. D379-3]